MARRGPFARHQNVYLRRYRVYIRPILRARYITTRRLRGGTFYTGRPTYARDIIVVVVVVAVAYHFQGELV